MSHDTARGWAFGLYRETSATRRRERDTTQGVPRYGVGGVRHDALRDDTVRDRCATTQGHDTAR